MITCTNCETENIEGTVYCDNCGSELPQNMFATVDTASSESPEIMDIPVTEPSGHCLTHSKSGEELNLPEKDELIIGREDPVSGVFPDLDTSFISGEEDGVSRQHAKITHADNQYYVEDLSSVNFTFINKVKLDPNMPSPINDGDELMLGRMKLVLNVN